MKINELGNWIVEKAEGMFFDTGSLSPVEMVAKLWSKVNEVVKAMNELFITVGDKVKSIIDDMKTSGELENYIDETILGGVRSDIDKAVNYVTPQMYGLKCDGVTNDLSAFNTMISSVPDGTVIRASLKQKILISTAAISVSNKKNITFENLYLIGVSDRTIMLENGSENITFRGCIFEGLNRVLNLYTCNNIIVEKCFFTYCGYGILGMTGYVHSNIKILNNTVKDSREDFVEMNSATVLCKNVLIQGNTFLGSNPDVMLPGHLGVEQRFVGITMVQNVTITNNTVYNVSGDAAIHLEVDGQECIVSNNHFENCKGNGYIFLVGALKNVIISNNTFVKRGSDVNTTSFIHLSHTADTMPINISGNLFKCNNMDSFSQMMFQTNLIFANNIIEACPKLDVVLNNRMIFTGNRYSGTEGITVSSYQLKNTIISNNIFEVTGTYAININSAATPATTAGVLITNNMMNKGIYVLRPRDITIDGNMLPAGNTSVTLDKPVGFFEQNIILGTNYVFTM